MACFHIQQLIADHIGIGLIHLIELLCHEKHSGLRFAAMACHPVFSNTVNRVMGAVEKMVDTGALLF